MRAWLMVVVLFSSLGCLPKVPRQRLAQRAKVAVGYLVEPSYSGEPFSPPAELKQAIAKELDEHNLEVVEIPLAAISGQRLTDARFEALKRAAGDAPVVLLIEQRVHFFSQIDGRYRWEVGTSLTAAREGGATAKDPFEIPVVLMYDHEKEREAIANAAHDVANRAGVLMDGVLAGANTAQSETK